ncbi:MAG: glycosyltransferase family 39 protein [Candidatus Bathyarchaeota archaeon]|nr:MAG: glycosyltransferase family 39 protein [Candidatus Bathyarchaeota archaeon]
MPKKNRRSPYLLLILGLIIILIGGVLRFFELGRKSLWTDEIASLRDSESVTSAINGSQPPFYYLVLHLFRNLGTNEFIIRLPSVIFGVLTIALSYWIGKLFFGSKEGLVSASLLSVSTFHIYYSQEARMYTLLAFLSLLSLFFFYRSLSERKKSLWAGFILSTLLTLYTHYFGVFVLLVETVFFMFLLIIGRFLARSKSERTRGHVYGLQNGFPALFILSIIILAAFFVPFLFWRAPRRISTFLPGAQNGSASSVPPLQLSFISKIFSEFSGGSPFSYGSSLLYLFLFFFLCGCVLSIKNHKEKLVLMLFWITLPIPLVFFASTRIDVYSEPRYVIHVLPIYLLIVSRGITSLPEYILSFPKVKTSIKGLFPFISSRSLRNHTTLYLVIFLTATMLVGLSATPLLTYYEEEKADWRAVATYLEAKSSVDDVIVVEPSHLMEPFSYYFRNAKNVSAQKMHGNISTLGKLYDEYDRVWFVTSASHRRSEMSDWLNQHSLWLKIFGGGLRVYSISQLPPAQSKAAIFTNLELSHSYISWWETTLHLAGTSITKFDDAIRISSVNLSDFNLVVFVDIKRPLDDEERYYLQARIDGGLTVMVSGLSPYWLAGGMTDLTSISAWFGATAFSEAPVKEKWGTRFTTAATEIMEDLDINREYAFYTESDWSTPTATIAKPESTIYAYREDGKATLFTSNFGNGTVIFNGVRYGFWSPDADIFQQFFQELAMSEMHL